MALDAADIARRIDRLDHPDAGLQDQILAELSAQAEAALPVVLANFPLANDRVRRALLRWLSDHLSPEATLPLMRYVFDERKSIPEQVGRTIAMGLLLRRGRATDDPQERGRLRAFAEDITSDDNPEIRRLALRILAFVGNQRSLSFVEPLLRDDDEEVRQSAHRALEALQDAPYDTGQSTLPKEQLLAELLQSAGPRRRQLLRQLHRHPEKGDIALELLRRKSDLQAQALQVLLKEPRSAARPLLANLVLDDPDDERATLALRLFSALATLEDDGTLRAKSDEVQAIRRAFHSVMPLTLSAAAAAAAAFGLRQFTRELCDLTLQRDLTVCLAAAAALAELLEPSDTELIRHLVHSVEVNDRRRQESKNAPDFLHLIAHLQVALRRIVTPRTLDVESVVRLALSELARAGHHRPIRVTALQLLLAATPETGFSEDQRFAPSDAAVLLDVLPNCDEASARRVATLLFRVAPEGLVGLDRAARDLYRGGYVDITDVIVPLLARADTELARELLEEIASGDDPEVVRAARRVLRRFRNEEEFIDAEFIPKDETK